MRFLRMIEQETRFGAPRRCQPITVSVQSTYQPLSSLNGVETVRIQRASWIISVVLAAAGGVLVASSAGLNAIVLSMLIVNAYAAAMFGRLRSLPITFAGAGVVGNVDLSGLSTLNAHLNTLSVGTSQSGAATGTLKLPVSNTNDALSIVVGSSGGGTLVFGNGTNTVLADQMIVAQNFSGATVTLPAGGTLSLGSAARPTALSIGQAVANTNDVHGGKLDLSGGTFNLGGNIGIVGGQLNANGTSGHDIGIRDRDGDRHGKRDGDGDRHGKRHRHRGHRRFARAPRRQRRTGTVRRCPA